MTDLLLPLAGATAIVLYWIVCRKRSLTFREKAASLVTAFVSDPSTTRVQAASAVNFYNHSTHWWFFPAACALGFFITPYMVFSGQTDTTDQEAKPLKRREITVTCMLMSITRNPLLAVILLTGFALQLLLWTAIGLIANRIRSFPSAESIFDSIDLGASRMRRSRTH